MTESGPMIDTHINALLDYAIRAELISGPERVWAANALIDALKLDSFKASRENAQSKNALSVNATFGNAISINASSVNAAPANASSLNAASPNEPEDDPVFRPGYLSAILSALTDDALARGLLDADSEGRRESFATALMGRLTPRPAQVIEQFWSLYAQSPRQATDWFYKFSQDTNYIHRDRLPLDIKWSAPSAYGTLDLSINLQKPEIDIRDIVASSKSTADSPSYPLCLLCAENEGYAGRPGHPPRSNHRIVPVTLGGEAWFLQYSPYAYYNEHCIALNAEHKPMVIDRACFEKLIDFIDLFPHYFIGSNSDQPVVGGSILSHEHFQGGRYDFPMAKAPLETMINFPGFDDVAAGIVKWPMSVIRLISEERSHLIDLACLILSTWKTYSDESVSVFDNKDGTPLSTITPIARRRGAGFELDLVLRNSLTSPEHPLGVFHPHAELHHIKKESIGLIEVMGLAILPPRLKREFGLIADVLTRPGVDTNVLPPGHREWAADIARRGVSDRSDIETILREETGSAYVKILEHCGVFKRDPRGKAAFARFIEAVKANCHNAV